MDWEWVRAQFALRTDLLHFAPFIIASHPRVVREAIELHRTGLDRDPVGYYRQNKLREEKGRAELAGYLDCPPEEVALTDSTTMGLALVYLGLKCRPGQEILTTSHEFYSTYECLRLKSTQSGTTVRQVDLYSEPRSAEEHQMVAALIGSITGNTRCLALTWVHSATGVKIPVKEICGEIRRINEDRAEHERIVVCVDAVHAVGVEDFSISELGCDFLVSGAHKWLFGPRGTGFVWGSTAGWNNVQPLIPNFGVMSGEQPTGFPGIIGTPGGFHSFEHRWSLADVFQFVNPIGKPAISEYISDQVTQMIGLLGAAGVEVATPADARRHAGIVSCKIAGRDSANVVDELRTDHGIVATTSPGEGEYVRLAPSIVTTPDQVEYVAEAMSRL
ncbi:aminotransferase class V-fold PLP-dependent enzyme [Amycolatopsis sp. NPDC051371]|uniref:aminotransferase class V-fold PLP-dependent enzyme n=1 Tax=Amycolatopsis sp. NPDC051371 TaxID=3155800 RepID=UPI00341D7630